MNIREMLPRDCFLYCNQINRDSIVYLDRIKLLNDADRKKFASIYKLHLISKYYQEYDKKMKNLDKFNDKYDNALLLGKLFWTVFSFETNEIRLIKEKIGSLINNDFNELKKNYYLIDEFILDLFDLKDSEEIQIIAKYTKNRLKKYMKLMSKDDNYGEDNLDYINECRECYQICIDCDWNIFKAKKVAIRRGIDSFLDKVREFALTYIKMNSSEFSLMITNSNRNSTSRKCQEVVDKLVLLDDDLEIFTFLDEYHLSKDEILNIKDNLYFYVASKLKIEEYGRVRQTVLVTRRKLNRYIQDTLRREKKIIEDEVNERDLSLVKGFIAGDFVSLEHYLKYLDMSEYLFKKSLSNVKKIDYKIYEEFLNVKKRKKDELVNIAFDDLSKMLDEVKNGIKLNNGSRRDFDILDYYKYTNIEIEEMSLFLFLNYSAGKISEDNYRVLFKKINKFIKSITYSNSEKLMSIDFKFIDQNGCEFSISNDEKADIIGYLMDNKIRLNNLTYVTAVRRYAKGLLGIKNSKLRSK